jgi:hypothetical protein
MTSGIGRSAPASRPRGSRIAFNGSPARIQFLLYFLKLLGAFLTILEPRMGVSEGPGRGKTTTSFHYKYPMAAPQFLGSGWGGPLHRTRPAGGPDKRWGNGAMSTDVSAVYWPWPVGRGHEYAPGSAGRRLAGYTGAHRAGGVPKALWSPPAGVLTGKRRRSEVQ